jgi:hypothetical protein
LRDLRRARVRRDHVTDMSSQTNGGLSIAGCSVPSEISRRRD